VALHPEFGDEGSLADMFLGSDGKTGLLVEEARKRGYLVLLPSSGSAFGWLAEPALTRLPGLVRRFVETWPVDPKQVFLWGHSLGASLTYRMLNLRNLWAAAAVVAGLPQRTFDYNTPADIPLALISGSNDLTVPPRQMLVVSYRLQRVIKQREIITLEGQDHWSAGAAGIPAAFRFFDQVRQAAPAAAPK
jgi:pimeloyl-ACP methyl ester carboxylesterase